MNFNMKLHWTIAFFFCLCASIFLMVLSIYSHESNIALTHDELWDYMHAVAYSKNSMIVPSYDMNVMGFRFPLITGPYQGAMKVWLVTPIIKAIGSSPFVLHSINIFFAVLYLLALYWALIALLDKTRATIVLLLPIVDTKFLLMASMDYGPFLLQNAFIALSIGLILRLFVAWNIRQFIAFCFILGCSFSQKLTATPIIISFALVSFIVMFPFIREQTAKKQYYRLIIVLISCAIVFMIPLVPYLIYFYNSGFSELLSLTASSQKYGYFVKLTNTIYALLDWKGNAWCEQISAYKPLDATGYYLPSIMCSVFIPVAFLLSLLERKNFSLRSPIIFVISMLLINILVYSFFDGLVRPWHYLSLQPIYIVTIVLSIFFTQRCFASSFKKHAIIVQGVFSIFFVFIMLSTFNNGRYILANIEREKGNLITSPALYRIAAVLKEIAPRKLYALNYSIGYPLYVILHGQVDMREFAFSSLTNKEISDIVNQIQAEQGVCLVSRFIKNYGNDKGWVSWLNKEPVIFDLQSILNQEKDNLFILRELDNYGTEFMLVCNNNGLKH